MANNAIDRDALLQELATRVTAGGFGAQLMTWMDSLPDMDPVLRKTGQSATILKELLADDQVFMAVRNRKLMTLNRTEFGFAPGAKDDQEPTSGADQLCKDLQADLARVDMRSLIKQVLDTPPFGYTVVELEWVERGGKPR